MSAFPKAEKWVPEAVVEAAMRIHADLSAEDFSPEGLAVLSRLISDPGMKLVWAELYKKKRIDHKTSEDFLHPARVTNRSSALEHRRQALELREKGGEENDLAASLLEAEATAEESIDVSTSDQRWNEQDRGAQIFLEQACRSAINIEPVFLSDLQDNAAKLRGIVASLREQSDILRSLGLDGEARKLKKLALTCEREVRNFEPNLSTDNPWVISRNRGNVRLKTYLVDLSISTKLIFGSKLFGTLATVAGVVFSCDVTVDQVRDLLRDPGV